MNIKDTIIFSLAVAVLIIGLHQAMTVGFENSYFLFMFSIGLLLWYKIRKNKRKQETSKTDSTNANSGKKLKK